MRQINKIVIHCSDHPDDRDIGFQEINKDHLINGWKSSSGVGCGYHYVIRKNGTVEVGRTPEEIGAHVPEANRTGIGICLVGRNKFTKEQFNSLQRMINSFSVLYPRATLHAHNEFPSAKKQGKTCPNINIHEVLK